MGMRIQMRNERNLSRRERKLRKCGDQLLLLRMAHKVEEHREVCPEWVVCQAVECLVVWAVCREWATLAVHQVAEMLRAQKLMKWIKSNGRIFFVFISMWLVCLCMFEMCNRLMHFLQIFLFFL